MIVAKLSPLHTAHANNPALYPKKATSLACEGRKLMFQQMLQLVL
jgi:hypothetical protein